MTQSIGFIGGGNIAEAIIGGLKKADAQFLIRASNRSNHERLQHLVDKYSITASNLEELVENSRVLIIAVKPKDVLGVVKQLKNYRLHDKLIISVAAGVPLKVFYKHLPGIAVIRAMPNTSTAVLHSMTGLARGENVTEEQAEMGGEIFSATGKIMWVPEEKINALTAISGSGPAYFYLFAESLIKAGVHLGLSEEEAEILVLETLIGAGKMIAESDKSPGKLREEVTSPNGTTYAALNVFTDDKLEFTVLKAAKACAQRAEDLEGENSD
ncbi:pyrroline-5-carboxylate reductase [Desulfosporosinus fructosivorans]|uniref:Pyrroline-5-carboxylate reductase n=1 Tax=Desulfosporosinus fructosivorans TaxID=2018669 RepID=A0A4Z0R9P7_9FIRM|nr:pyrroline-5-carboxylate reductase [Desulfosporosinus fructosivorans]TGE38783.1 pyrroline-5-carboxylate reductase [Desulfosporosinus fructosivorans]